MTKEKLVGKCFASAMWTKLISLDGDCASWTSNCNRTADLILVFGPTDAFRDSQTLANLRSLAPEALICGCSTGTTIQGSDLDNELPRALAMGFDDTKVRRASTGLVDGSAEAGRALGQALAADDLQLVLVFSDGLGVNGSALVAGLSTELSPGVTIAGGLAGDGARFERTAVIDGLETAADKVTAIGFYGTSLRIGTGTGGGWKEFGPARCITKSEGNVLHQLDGQPALDLYERYLGEEAENLPASALLFPLLICDPARPEEAVVRTVLSVDREAKTMVFAGDLPQGWEARLMRGHLDSLVGGAEQAMARALKNFKKTDPELSPCLSLMVSCVGRRLLMGQRTEEEVEAVTARLCADANQIGFYSYGEIAPHDATGCAGLHNQTVTMTLIAEAA